MGNTIYASFQDAALAEKAAGALLDFGVQANDISLVRGSEEQNTYIEDNRPTYDNHRTGDTIPGDYNGTVPPPTIGERLIGQPNQFGTTSTSDLMAPSDTIGSETSYGSSSVDPETTYMNTGNQAIYTRDADGNVTKEEPAESSNRGIDNVAKHGITTTTASDAEAGAMTGAAWGAGAGVLAAIAALVIPGFGLIVGGGALAIALGGVVASAGAGAAAGAVTGYLKDQGVDGHVAEHYERSVANGGALLAVTVPSGQVSEFDARNLLEKYGATNVNAYASHGYLA